MSLKIKNASVLPKRYYGLHMVEGLAEYKDIKHEGEGPFRIYLSENVIKKMDGTFSGCPVYVRHVDQVDLPNLESQADGYVVKSFFNRADGKHWVEFMAVTDRAHEAIAKGWKLSNAYQPTLFGNGGTWHAMNYAKEVLEAKYEHLAIVPDPRYQESVILTPEDFKSYNDQKEAELVNLQNSLNEQIKQQPQKSEGARKVKLPKFWNKADAANSDEVAQLVVTLPRSGRDVTITQLVNEADEAEMKKNEDEKDEKKNDNDGSEDVMANDNHMVEVGGEKMKLNAFKAKYNEMCEAAKKQNSENLGQGEDLATAQSKKAETTTQNSINALRNASDKVFENADAEITIPFDSLSLGRKLY